MMKTKISKIDIENSRKIKMSALYSLPKTLDKSKIITEWKFHFTISIDLSIP